MSCSALVSREKYNTFLPVNAKHLAHATKKFNSKRIVAGKKTGRVYKSNSFTIPHVKTTIGANEIRTAAQGKLKADIQGTATPDYVRVSYDSKGVA